MRAIYYHSVLTAPLPGNFYAASAITAEQLEAHATELARHWTVLSLAEVHDHLGGGRPLPDGSVHVSFDDGFRNNLAAAEIFDAHRLPWTLFAVSRAVLDGYTPWYVRLADTLARSSATVRVDGSDFDLSTPAGKQRLKERIKAEVMAAPASRHYAVLEQRLAEAGLPQPDETAWPFLSPAELSDLAGRGVEIGNHSATHPNLARCTPAELDAELGESQQRLAALIGKPVPFLSYPDGRFNRRVVTRAAATHDLAMATWTSRDPLAPMQLRRFSVGSTVEDLREVLSPGYPSRYRMRMVKWAVRRRIRHARLRPSRSPAAHASS